MSRQAAMLSWFLVGLALWSGDPAWAQSRTMERAHHVEGTVRFAETRTPAPGTLVVLEQRGIIRGQLFTDTNGRFSFSRVGPGEYALSASLEGYETARLVISVQNSSVLGASLELRPRVTPSLWGQHTVDVDALSLSPEGRRQQEKGLQELRQGRWEASLPHFRRVTSLHPDFAGAYLGLGIAHYHLQQFEPAEHALRNSIQLDRNLALACVFLGRLLNDWSRSDEATEVLENALARGPERWELHYELARALAAQEEFVAAEDRLRQAHEFDDTGPNVHLLLADLLVLRGAGKEALAEMQHYLEQHPDGPFAAQVRARVRHLKSGSNQFAPQD